MPTRKLKSPDPSRTPITNQHKARMLVIDGRRVRIDRDIAPLIESLNKLDIRTTSSCQANCYNSCTRKHKRLPSIKQLGWENGKHVQVTVYRHAKPKLCRESVTVVFATPDDASEFLNVVYRNSDLEKLRDHMLGHGRKQSHAWMWSHRIADFNDNSGWDSKGRWVEDRIGPSELRFYTTCVFPRAHLQLVTERVLAAVGK